ncbi:MAG: restriction endonuclease subunit S, partial [Candidatus Omnitrophica bacterium]|nr:restriction endonuclease subunit S [Candidatus Omnitrophota bacterium]
NKKRQNEILEKTAMAIFKNWFIDFEPFKDGEFVDSELGKIPNGWEVNFISKLMLFDPSENLDKNVVYPYVEMKHVSTTSMVCEFDHKHYTGSGSKFRFGDTLFARITPCLENGKIALVWFLNSDEKGFGSTEFIVMRGKYEYLKEFIYLFAKTDDFREFAINSMSGTSGRQRVIKEALEMYKFAIPPSSILQKFHSLVEPLFQKVILNQKQIMVLRKVRDKLLPLLVFGKLRVEKI